MIVYVNESLNLMFIIYSDRVSSENLAKIAQFIWISFTISLWIFWRVKVVVA